MKKMLMFLSLTVILLIPYIATQVLAEDEHLNNTSHKNEQELEIISTLADYQDYDSLTPMEEAADIIVVGSPTEDFLNREHKTVYNEDDNTIMDFYTNTDIEVKEILKDTNNDISANRLNVVEPISVIDVEGTEKIITTDVYSYMKKEATYIIFLIENTFGEYTVVNMNSGKYDMTGSDNDDITGYHSQELSEIRPDKTAEKKSIFREIKSKYNIN